MVYASSRDALKRSLVSLAVEISATDYSEMDYETGEFISTFSILPLRAPSAIDLLSLPLGLMQF
jgi:hypothetical protein